MISKENFENLKNLKQVERTRWSIGGIAAFLDDASQTLFDHYAEAYGNEDEALEVVEVSFLNMLTRLFDDLEDSRTTNFAPTLENMITERFEEWYADWRQFI